MSLQYLEDETKEVDSSSVVAVQSLRNPGISLQLPLYTFSVIARSCKKEEFQELKSRMEVLRITNCLQNTPFYKNDENIEDKKSHH